MSLSPSELGGPSVSKTASHHSSPTNVCFLTVMSEPTCMYVFPSVEFAFTGERIRDGCVDVSRPCVEEGSGLKPQLHDMVHVEVFTVRPRRGWAGLRWLSCFFALLTLHPSPFTVYLFPFTSTFTLCVYHSLPTT